MTPVWPLAELHWQPGQRSVHCRPTLYQCIRPRAGRNQVIDNTLDRWMIQLLFHSLHEAVRVTRPDRIHREIDSKYELTPERKYSCQPAAGVCESFVPLFNILLTHINPPIVFRSKPVTWILGAPWKHRNVSAVWIYKEGVKKALQIFKIWDSESHTDRINKITSCCAQQMISSRFAFSLLWVQFFIKNY